MYIVHCVNVIFFTNGIFDLTEFFFELSQFELTVSDLYNGIVDKLEWMDEHRARDFNGVLNVVTFVACLLRFFELKSNFAFTTFTEFVTGFVFGGGFMISWKKGHRKCFLSLSLL